MGAGHVTIRHSGHEICHPAPTAFKLDQLGGAMLAGEQGRPLQTYTPPQAIVEAEETLRKPPSDWGDRSDARGDDLASVTPFIELIVWVRAQLRAAKQWALADEIRQQLSKLGIILKDGPTETTWRKD
jgi:cysteinyl-tRNA synthetase